MLPLRRLIPILCVLALVPASVVAPAGAADVVIHVDQSATGAGDGTSWTDAYPELQEAFAVLTGGETIWVAEGTYRPDYDPGTEARTGDISASFELHELTGVELYGGFPAGGGDGTFAARAPATYVTVLDGDLAGDDDNFSNVSDNSTHVVHVNGGGSHVIDGVTITGGHAVTTLTPTASWYGGGLYAYLTSLTVRSTTFDTNSAQYGGGMYAARTDAIIEDCTYFNNSAYRGSGLFHEGGSTSDGGASSIEVRGSRFTGNDGRDWVNSNPTTGGGVAISHANVDITDSVFDSNSADEGGGLSIYSFDEGDRATVADTLIVQNVGAWGAGVGIHDTNLHLANVRISGNVAANFWRPWPYKTVAGGGIALWNQNSISSHVEITNSMISGNEAPLGGAIHVDDSDEYIHMSVSVANSTLWGNTATDTGGVWTSVPTVYIANSILWGNSGGQLGAAVESDGLPAVTHSIVEGGADGWNVLDVDPLFVDADGSDNTTGTADDDPTVATTSPAVDAGYNDEVPADATDLDGDGDTTEPVPVDLLSNLRFIDVPDVVDSGTGSAPLVDIGAAELAWPTAVDDAWTATEDTTRTVAAPGVLANDYDGDGDPLTAALVGDAPNGSVTLNANGSFTYTPDANFNGTDTFTYRVYDGDTYSDPATVTITVTPVNDAPTAGNGGGGAFIIPDITSCVDEGASLLHVAEDVDGDALTAHLYEDADHLDVTLNTDGTWCADVAGSWPGSDSFRWRAWDGQAWSNVATATLTTNPDYEFVDLTLSKTADRSSVDVGQVLTYTLTVHNAGPDPATGVAVNDGLPSNVQFESASAGCTETDNTVVCELGTIGVGRTATVQVRVTPIGSGAITNNAHIGYPGHDPDGDLGASVTVQSLLPDPGFDDTDGTTFEDDIAWMWAMGITKGCNPPFNTEYCPDDYVTRGQMAAFLVRALDYTAGAGDDLFDDDDTSIFESDIDRLATAGVTKGCNPPINDHYCPDDYVTRGQMAAFLHRALGT